MTVSHYFILDKSVNQYALNWAARKMKQNVIGKLDYKCYMN
jgi:hypothetical protein